MIKIASAKTQSPAPHSEPVSPCEALDESKSRGNDEQQQTWAQQHQLMWVHTGLSASVQESLPLMQQKKQQEEQKPVAMHMVPLQQK